MTHWQVFERLRDALGPLGIEIVCEVVDVWLDREVHGREARPVAALRDLEAWAARLLGDES